MIEFTDWAREILRNSAANSRRFNPDARIRLGHTGDGVQAMFAEGPEPGDVEVDVEDGVRIFVESGLDGLVDVVEPHDSLVLRPAGSIPNDPGHHRLG